MKKIIPYLILLLVISVIIASCESLLQQSNSGDVSGEWTLSYNSSGTRDICPGENVNFQSNGVALLKCPQGTQLSRNYTYSNNTLEYTQTGVKYSTSFGNNNNTMQLNGINVQRILVYTKGTITTNNSADNPSQMNSSEGYTK